MSVFLVSLVIVLTFTATVRPDYLPKLIDIDADKHALHQNGSYSVLDVLQEDFRGAFSAVCRHCEEMVSISLVDGQRPLSSRCAFVIYNLFVVAAGVEEGTTAVGIDP